MADNSFIAEKASNTPEKYRFKLFNPDTNQEQTLRVPPIEWESGTIQLDRDIDVGGVFVSFVVDSLTFIKEGAKFLRDIWNEKEINGRCDLIVSYLKLPQMEYQEMPSRFSLNFATCKPYVKVGNQSIGFLIEATKSDILVKLENRRDKDIDISKRYITVDSEGNNKEYIKTIGGAELLPYSESPYLPLKKNIAFDSIDVDFNTVFVGNYTNSGRINNNDDYWIYTQFDMQFSANDITECQEVSYKTDIRNINDIVNCLENSQEDKEIVFSYDLVVEVTNRKGGIFNPRNVYAFFLEVIDSDNNIISSERVEDIGKFKNYYFLKDTRTLNVKTGESVRFYIRTDDTSGIDAYIRDSKIKITQNVAQYEGKTCEGFPLYEACERTLQHITDTQFPFYSEFLGRTDVVYNLSGDKYSSENQLRFAHVLSGLNLRGRPEDLKGGTLFDDNIPLSINFDDLFDSVNALYNIGYQEETIDGFKRIRFENYGWFFDDIMALDLSDRLTRYDIESEVMSELAYVEVKSGFEDYSYERINGRGEFNTESSRTSIINTDSTYEIVSKLRADTMGISEKITQELTTEDTEEDNELFIIKTQRGNDWKPEKQENITIDDNTSLFGADSFNLYYSPTRMLVRHGNRLKASLLKYLSSYFRFQKSDKLQTLRTTGEGYSVTENDDILVNSLDSAIWKPIKHTVTCKFTFDDFETFLANKKGWIKLSNEISGYLLSLKKVNNEDRATIEIIEKV